jgi:hypothetical protein
MVRFPARRLRVARNESDPQQYEADGVRIAAQEAAPSRDFAEIPVFSSGRAERFLMPPDILAPGLPGIIQAKLEFGAVDDLLEDEADRVADRVMRMPDPKPPTAIVPLRLSRIGPAGESSGTQIARSEQTRSSQA